MARTLNEQAVLRATSLAEIRTRRADLQKYLTDSSSQIQIIDSQMRDKEQQLLVYLNRLIERLHTNIRDSEKLLAGTQTQQQMLDQQPELTSELDNLTLEAKEKQELASTVKKQLQDSEFESSVERITQHLVKLKVDLTS